MIIKISPSKKTIYVLLTIIFFGMIFILIPNWNYVKKSYIELLPTFVIFLIITYYFVLVEYKNFEVSDDFFLIEYSYFSAKLKKINIFELKNIKEIHFTTHKSIGIRPPSIKILCYNNPEVIKFSYHLADKQIELKALFDFLKNKKINIFVDGYVWETSYWSPTVRDVRQ